MKWNKVKLSNLKTRNEGRIELLLHVTVVMNLFDEMEVADGVWRSRDEPGEPHIEIWI
jgi:hypothetical protein